MIMTGFVQSSQSSSPCVRCSHKPRLHTARVQVQPAKDLHRHSLASIGKPSTGERARICLRFSVGSTCDSTWLQLLQLPINLNMSGVAQSLTSGGAHRRFWYPCFHLPGQAILEFRFFEPYPCRFINQLSAKPSQQLTWAVKGFTRQPLQRHNREAHEKANQPSKPGLATAAGGGGRF